MEIIKSTDRTHRITVKAKIVALHWSQDCAIAGEAISLRIDTCFLGRNSKLQISIFDSKTRLHKHTLKAYSASMEYRFMVNSKAKERIYAEVTLPGNRASATSRAIRVLPAHPMIFNLRWDQQQLTSQFTPQPSPQQRLRIQADCVHIEDGEQVSFALHLSSQQTGEAPIAGFTSRVNKNRLDQAWQAHFPLSQHHLPFQEQLSPAANSNHETLVYTVAEFYGKRFKQPRQHWLRLRSSLRIELDPAFANTECQLIGSDGQQQTIHIHQNLKQPLEISAGPCILLFNLDTLPCAEMKHRIQDKHHDQLRLPACLVLPQRMNYIPAPLQARFYANACFFRAKQWREDLIGDGSEEPVRYSASKQLLAIKSQNAQGWQYYRVVKNLLYAVVALDACGKTLTGAAVAYIDNAGFINPFYLCGEESGYRYTVYRDAEKINRLAVWSCSDRFIRIGLAQKTLALALARLDNRP